nr:hypothetical protein [Candidatus Sigynarchaeota archaeon]
MIRSTPVKISLTLAGNGCSFVVMRVSEMMPILYVVGGLLRNVLLKDQEIRQ